MVTFHKVQNLVGEKRCYFYYAGEVQAEKRPISTYEEGRNFDIYTDYFDTKEDAISFIESQSKEMNS